MPKMIVIVWGMAMSRPSAEMTLAVVEAVGMNRNRNRSKASPSSGATISTDTTKAAHLGQWCDTTSRSNTNADTNAWAPKARLNTPVAR